MDRFSQVVEFRLSDATINRLNSTMKKCMRNPNLLNNSINCTKKGKQSVNVISLLDQSSLQEISQYVNEYIKNYYSEALQFYLFFIDYVHFISYDVGGHQLGHTHHEYEDHSFIIYLNDSNAMTKIFCKDSFKTIKSEKGKMVVFDASLYHEADECDEMRNIAVGSVKFSHKIWFNRKFL